MSSWRHEQQRMVVVARPATRADADLLRVTLAAHGFEAVVAASSSAYPSIDFVEGFSVSVRGEDEARVRELLRALGATTDAD